MQNHVKNYFKAFGYDESDIILCEVCHSVAVDIHHVEFRSKFGTRSRSIQDAVGNLVALCRSCHDKAHGINALVFKERLKEIVENRLSK